MKKKKISFPSALTVLFIVLIFAAILTAIVPAGLYSKLTYNADHDVFEITTPDGDVTEMAPTQETLDELGVTGNLNKFLDGSISKPIAVPGTYQKVEQQPQGVFKILLAAIKGVYDTIDIILFLFSRTDPLDESGTGTVYFNSRGTGGLLWSRCSDHGRQRYR